MVELRTILVAFALISLLGCTKHQQDERSLDNALSTFELEEGFQIELIAGEPLVADPVDMEIDEFGRMYVVEMHGYPLDISGTGKVRLLSDTDGDGVMDKSIVFADSLIMPTGIMRWKKGVIVTDPPHVYYLEDSDGDGKADIKEIMLTGFALSNPQHNVNSPKLGLDNWIYLGHEPAVTTTIYEEKFGDRGSEVHFPANPTGIKLPENAGGRSVRFKPESFDLELLGSRTQFGHTIDEWGHRFLVNNSNHIIQDVMSANYLDRNPFLVIPEVTQSVSDHGSAAEVFPITKNPEHQLLTDVGVMTSACGITAYLGGIFPDKYRNSMFVAEPVSNIVHVDIVQDKGTGFVASRDHSEKEFLASTDSWFRPVNMYVGPDGALYILDYYRQIIEHPEWMAEEVVNSGALYNGTDKGRIYRITPEGTPPLNWSENLNLGSTSTDSLIHYLGHRNFWWRMNAQRILIDSQQKELKGDLKQVVFNESNPFARLHALWTLEGMGTLDSETVIKALSDKEAGIRENAIKLAESFLNNSPEMVSELLKLQDDNNSKVRLQLLCTLGFVEGPNAFQARKKLLFQDIDDRWVQLAGLAAPFSESFKLMEPVLGNFNKANPSYVEITRRIGAMVGASMDEKAIYSLVKKSISSTSKESKGWEAPLLAGVAQGIKSKSLSGNHGLTEEVLISAVFEHPSVDIRKASIQVLEGIGVSKNNNTAVVFDRAKEYAANRSLDGDIRSLGIKFLSLSDPLPYKALFTELIEANEPLQVQLASFNALSLTHDGSLQELVLSKWESFTPELRDAAINAMMMNPERIEKLLNALESGLIQTSTIGWRRSVALMANKDEKLRIKARAIFATPEGESEKIIQEYKAALEIQGSMENGKVVFQRNCALCHKMGEEMGLAFGPDLSSLKNRRPINILSDILNPNLSIADGYDLWEVELQNGETHQGLISSETPTAINLRNAGGMDKNIARSDIKSIRVLDMSAMPSGLEQSISIEEMADLLAYIKRTQ